MEVCHPATEKHHGPKMVSEESQNAHERATNTQSIITYLDRLVVVLVWSTVLEGQKPTQGPACTVIPFHIV